MSLTTEQKVGLSGALLASVSAIFTVGMEPVLGFFLLLPSLISGFLVYKYPDPNTKVRVVCLLSAVLVWWPAIGGIVTEADFAVPATTAGVGALMWTAAMFPQILQQET